MFKWAAWYVYGYCLSKNEYRLFKLNRLWKLENTGISYIPRDIPDEKLDFAPVFSNRRNKADSFI